MEFCQLVPTSTPISLRFNDGFLIHLCNGCAKSVHIFQSTGFLSAAVWKQWRHYITLWNPISFGKLMESFHYLHCFGRKGMVVVSSRSY